jgi:nucleotide-binding universal stress UspA family protein
MTIAPRTVVVPLDGTPFGERALPVALDLASSLGLPIELIRVVDDEAAVIAETYLSDIAGSLHDVDVATRVETGRPEVTLAHLADGDLAVCLATHGHGGLAGVALGRVGDDLLRTVPSTFVFVGPHTTTRPGPAGGHIVLCFDGSPEASAVVPIVDVLARVLELHVHVTMVLHRHGEYLGDHEATGAKRAAQALVDDLTRAGLEASLDLVEGIEPARAIARYADDLPARFVAAASHGERGVLRAVIGSTAMRIVHHAPCPVIVCRPGA